MGLLFTIIMRPVLEGHVPLAVVDAPVQGTGKSLLIESLVTVALGSISGSSIPDKQNEDEWRKKITSILLAAESVVMLDNLPDNTTLDSPALAAVLTLHEWSDRLLGSNTTTRLPARTIWVATGNNLRVARDLPSRSYSIRLDANMEYPWKRKGFKIANIKQHIKRWRGDYLAAALTVIRGWYVRGQPQAEVPTLGSFEEWTKTIGSILAFAGIEGFLANLQDTQEIQDEETQQWRAFFAAWWEVFKDTEKTVDDICQRLIEQPDSDTRQLPDALKAYKGREGRAGALRLALGRHLSRLVNRFFDGRKLMRGELDSHSKVRGWQLVQKQAPA
jgi:hypothetical protein